MILEDGTTCRHCGADCGDVVCDDCLYATCHRCDVVYGDPAELFVCANGDRACVYCFEVPDDCVSDEERRDMGYECCSGCGTWFDTERCTLCGTRVAASQGPENETLKAKRRSSS